MPLVFFFNFFANFLHALIMWLTVWAQLPYNLLLLFFCVLSVFALSLLVLITLLKSSSERDFVPLFRFSLRSHVQQAISSATSLICHLIFLFFPLFGFFFFVVFLFALVSVEYWYYWLLWSVFFVLFCEFPLNCLIVASTQSSILARTQPPSFLDT